MTEKARAACNLQRKAPRGAESTSKEMERGEPRQNTGVYQQILGEKSGRNGRNIKRSSKRRGKP